MTKKNAPRTEEAVADTIRKAAGSGNTIEIVGGGTKRGLGQGVMAGEQLSTKQLSGITLYEPGALTLVAKAGTPLRDVQAALSKENQHLPFEPPTYEKLLGTGGEPTIGGVVACGVSGPRRIQAGACRDSLIGVRFVDGSGDIIKNGGRVMKNVTGYDLVKLMCGAYGTLGVLTEVSFKLLPAPETSASICVEGLEFEQASKALSQALGSPFDVTGAAYLPEMGSQDARAVVRIEGFEKSVAYRSEAMRKILASYGDVTTIDDKETSMALWREIGEAERHSAQDGAVWRLSVKPTDGPKLIHALARDGEFDYLADWGGGLIWLRADAAQLQTWTKNAGDDAVVQHDGLVNLHNRLQKEVGILGGHATLFRAHDKNAIQNVFQPEPEPVAKISAGLRAKFDPAGVLNPGRMGN